MYVKVVTSVTDVYLPYMNFLYVCSCLPCKTTGLQAIIMAGFQTLIGALKEVQATGEVLDLLEIGWMLMMMLRMDSDEVVAAAELKIGGLGTLEAVAVIG